MMNGAKKSDSSIVPANADGLTWADYAADLDRNLTDLHARVHSGAYRALPSRRKYIPKADGKQRPLAIATAPSNCTAVPSAFRIG